MECCRLTWCGVLVGWSGAWNGGGGSLSAAAAGGGGGVALALAVVVVVVVSGGMFRPRGRVFSCCSRLYNQIPLSRPLAPRLLAFLLLAHSRLQCALIIALVASGGVSNVLNNTTKTGRNLSAASRLVFRPRLRVSTLLNVSHLTRAGLRLLPPARPSIADGLRLAACGLAPC